MPLHSRIIKALCATALLILLLLLYSSLSLPPRLLDKYIEFRAHLFSYPRTNIVRHQVNNCQSDDPSIVKFTKTFVYLIQTESCTADHLLQSDVFGDPTACQCDLVVLGYKQKCNDTSHKHIEYTFNPTSTWTIGREQLYKTSVQSGKKYLYYIFMDDDVVLEVVDKRNKRNPWRLFEDFLLRVRPPIAASDIENWNFVDRIFRLRNYYGCQHEYTDEYVPALFFDAMFNAFHHEAVKSVFEPLIPYWGKYDNVSWWYSQWYMVYMSDIVYHHQVVHNVEIMGMNLLHRPYTRKHEVVSIIQSILGEVQQILPKEFQRKSERIAKEWQASNYDRRRKGFDTYCIEPPQPSCVKPYTFIAGV